MPHFSGRVVSIVYENSEFYVLRVSLDDKSVLLPAAVRGTFPSVNIKPGTWLSFDAQWEEHSAYGKQLTVTRFPVTPPTWTVQSVLSILSAEGVGPTACQTLKSSMGEGLHAALNEGPEALIPSGLDAFTREHVIAKWRMAISHLKSTSFLQDAGVPQKVVSRVWATLGDQAEEVLTKDPWSLLKVEGITFQQADEVATRLGLPLDTPLRTRGAALFALRKARMEGNLYLTPPDLSEAARNLAPASPFLSGETLVGELEKEGLAKLVAVDGIQAVYEPWSLLLEEDSSKRLLQRGATSEIRGDGDQALREVEDWSSIHHVTLTPNQQLAAINALTEPVSILTGLPGTGKTTTLRAVVQILIERRVSFLLCAPTGIAAKRMSSVTGAPAATIHRAFGAKGFDTGEEREANYSGIIGDKNSPGSSKPGLGEKWACTPKDPHRAKVVICDESSMLDQHLLYRILSGTAPDCRLVFVGDAAQLPSVGPGDVLRNLISSGKFPTVSLTDIFRQQDTSGIVVAAHDIFKGQAPTSDGKDFVIVEAQEEETAAATIQRISERLYGARANFQILSPRHGGAAGVTALNQRLRNALNPAVSGLSEIRLGAETVREDDRVMIVKNDYNLDVYNGDVGKVSRIDRKAREIEITLYNESPPRLVRIPFSDASGKLRLAYAQTVHKSQGQEYDIIVVPILPSFSLQLQRNLYYTAVTRAKKKAILVGTYQALCRAVANDKAEKRNTLLSLRLSSPELFEGGSSKPEDA
jgi:exodeoxyribonuclease V alpha subunit